MSSEERAVRSAEVFKHVYGGDGSSLADQCDKNVVMLVSSVKAAEWTMRHLKIYAIPVGAAIGGRTFDKVILATAPRPGSSVIEAQFNEWLEHLVKTKIRPGGEFIIL